MDLDDGNDARLPFGRAHGSSNPAMLIIGAEDEEFENDIDPNVDDNCSQFQCIDLLKDRPTYLIIFLHHVILQFDASYVLCYLHGEMFKRANVKDARRMFVDYFHTFLDRGAVLRVPVPHDISFELDRCRPDLLCDDGVKNIVKEMQKVTALEIYNQLEDFRNKRMMGMTIGEKELSELDSDRLIDTTTFEMKERLLAEQLLPKVEEATSNTDDEKSTSVYNAVVTYMKFLGVKTKEPRPLEKKRHFLIRRKGPTVRKESEPVRPDEKKRKGIGSILDLRRPPRGDPSTSSSGADVKLDGVKPSIDRKNSSQAGKSQSESSTGRQKPILAFPEGSDTAPGSGASHTLSREDSECDPNHPSSSSRAGNENQSFPDCGDSGVPAGSSIEQVLGGEYSQEEGAESERRKLRLPAKLRRSESLRAYGERRRSHKGPAKGKQPRSRSDVDLQAAATATHLQGQNSAEPGGSGGPDSQQSFLSAQPEDSGPRVPELEADPPNWRQLVDSETVHRLKKSEVKRQEVINELFITEHAHVRMLKVLYEIFYQRMLAEAILPDTELQNIFPSLDELIEVHVCFYEMIKKLRDEGGYVVMYIGSTLLARFNGTEGDWFKKLASRFCSRQSYALEQIKTRHRKDGRFSQFIQDAESNPQCRRLQLKDIIPIEMQRLTKYPLLLENIAKYTDQPTEKQMVQQAAECCRNILKDVNQEVRETENLRRLHDYQRRLDVSNLRLSPDLSVADFKNIDLTQRRMVHEGPLIWKVTKEKAVDVHVLLLDDILVLMQKVDDKMVLKCHSKNAVGGPDGKQMLCPIIKLGSLLARDVATDRKAFFVLFQTNTGAQIYELVAQTVSERKNWCEWILSTQEALNQQRPSTAPRNSLVPPAVSLPLSPTMMYKEPVLTSDSSICSRDRIHSDFGGRDSDVISQDSGTGELGFDGEVPNVGQALTDVLKANDIDLNKLAQGTSEHIADGALEDVHAMKWQLKTSKRAGREPSALPPRALSEGEQEPGRGTGEAEADEEQEAEVEDGEGSVTEEQQEPERGEELPEHQGDEEETLKGTAEDLHAKEMFPEGTPGSMATDRDTECSRTPVILSLEQAEEMERKMNSVLVKIQHLKAMEEDYHRLRQALLKLTITPRQLTGCQRQAPGEKW